VRPLAARTALAACVAHCALGGAGCGTVAARVEHTYVERRVERVSVHAFTADDRPERLPGPDETHFELVREDNPQVRRAAIEKTAVTPIVLGVVTLIFLVLAVGAQ